MHISHLFTGGARSGKSRLAQAWAESQPGPWHYVATARDPGPADPEMARRIARHRQERGPGWITHETEEPAAILANLLRGAAIIDCLTLWLTALGERHAWDDHRILAEVDALAMILRHPPIPVAVITNEVGSGIVPAHPLARQFQDLQGWTNQRIAAACGPVHLVVCGRQTILSAH